MMLITVKQALQYETCSSVLASLARPEWMRELVARWILWRVERKYNRYRNVVVYRNKMHGGGK
jgi:hypothetical protein